MTKDKEISVEVSDALKMTDEVRASLKTIFGPQHMLAAAHFSRLIEKIETENQAKPLSDEIQTEHRAYAVAAVLSAVASIEAVINEFYLEAKDRSASRLGSNLPALLAEMWEVLEEMRRSPLEKYQVALAAAGMQRFDQGKAPYQQVRLLVELRNALTHYRPEWDDRQRRHKKMEKSLRGLFPPNPLGHGAFFPCRCLGHGCADWAVRSGVEFVDAFFNRMGLPKPFDYCRERLRTAAQV